MNKRYYEHTLPIIRGSLSNTYVFYLQKHRPDFGRLFFISKNTVPISDGCFLSPKTPSRFRTAVFYLQKHRPDFGRLFFISKNTVPISDGCFLSPKTPSRFRTAVSMSKNAVLILGNYIPPFKSNFL